MRKASVYPERIKVIFVGGAGRSGSTLLDRILGQMDGFCSLGEMYHIWSRGVIQNQLCGCGTFFGECSFWQTVLHEAFPSETWEDGNVFLQLQNAVSRYRHTPLFLFPSMRSRSFCSNLSEYLTIMERLYKAIAKVSGCSVLIDSSKLPAHGFVLSEIPGIDLSLIHLVRDSRAVVYSWQRKKIRPEIYWKETYMPRTGVLKSCYELLLSTLLIKLLSQRVKNHLVLKYEDFSTFPEEEVRNIMKWIGISREPKFFSEKRRVYLGVDHTVSGNPVRFSHGPIDIISDVAWRSGMSFFEKLIVSGFTFPFLIRYLPNKKRLSKETH